MPSTSLSRRDERRKRPWPARLRRSRRGSIACRASKYTRNLIILISLGGCFELYDLFFGAYIAAGLFAGKLFTPTTQMFFGFEGFASFVAAQFAGMFIGTILVSHLSDRYGRRAMFTYSLLWYSVGQPDHGVPERRARRQPVALHRLDRRRRRAGHHRCLRVGAGAAGASRPRLRLQPDPAVLHRAAGGLHLLPAGADQRAGLGRLALGGGDRLGGRAVHLVDPSRPAGIAALARPARPADRGRGDHAEDGDRDPRRNRPRVAAAPDIEQRARGDQRLVVGDVERHLSRPHHHDDRLQPAADDRLLRLLELGADAADRQAHRRHQVARIHLHHRARRAARTADRLLRRRQDRAQMAGRRLRPRHRRVRPAVRPADGRGADHRCSAS